MSNRGDRNDQGYMNDRGDMQDRVDNLDRFTKNFFWNFKMCIANSMEDYHSGQLAKKIFPQMSLLHKVLAKNGPKMVKKGQK